MREDSSAPARRSSSSVGFTGSVVVEDAPAVLPRRHAQLRLTDVDGWRITVFATNTGRGRLADLELRHRQRARAEDRIRCLKDTGLRNLPLHDLAANDIWIEIVLLAADLLAWTQILAFTGTPARVWEPKRLRLRLLHLAGGSSRPDGDTGCACHTAGHGRTCSAAASTASPR